MSERSIYQQLRSHLAYLRLGAAAERLAAALEQAEQEKPSYTRFLERLLAVEVEATERRRLEGRLRFASFPTQKTLAEIDYDAQPALDRRMVEELATLRFVEERSNLLLIGPPGVGKTMLAVALGRKAAEVGYRVYDTTAADLVTKSQRAALEGRWQTTMRFWNGPQLLICDELGYLPLPAEAASHLFQVVSRRYEHGSIILTTNRGIASHARARSWGICVSTSGELRRALTPRPHPARNPGRRSAIRSGGGVNCESRVASCPQYFVVSPHLDGVALDAITAGSSHRRC